MTSRPIALIAIPVAAFGLGYWVAPKEQLYQQVEHTGFLQVDTSKVLATTVESLRGENKMLVFAYKGTARVSVKCTMHKKWIFWRTPPITPTASPKSTCA